jgi:hypothetical protein
VLSVQNCKQTGIISTHPVAGIVFFEMGTHITKNRVPSKLIGRNGIIFVPDACDCKPKKRQENSEFWCAENRAEVTKRMMAGKYASFEPLSAIR